MKLYDLPRGSLFRVNEEARVPVASLPSTPTTVYHFIHLDGMYSLVTIVTPSKGESVDDIVHFAAGTEVTPLTPDESKAMRCPIKPMVF
jgi:hypothetical protein